MIIEENVRRGDENEAQAPAAAVYSVKNPFPARLISHRMLNKPGSEKETRHFEVCIEGSGMTYEPGDSLGIKPANWPELVEDVLRALRFSGEEIISNGAGAMNIRSALLTEYQITRPMRPLLEALAEKSGGEELTRLLAPESKQELEKYLWGREVIDFLLEYPQVTFEPDEFVRLLKKLLPRLYSIASSQLVYPNEAHLVVAIVKYNSYGRDRKGVASTFLAERIFDQDTLPVFIHHNKNFKLPKDSNSPVIMVGPGTGLAPFRAFLQERRAMGATGKNWLFFGDQHEKSDYIYGEELDAMLQDGTLSKLSKAFSRDQPQKIYVQHRMLEEPKELFSWLEEGAHFYVCGDASRMAKDVDQALHRIIEIGGGKTAEQAVEYVKKMTAEKRYQRDVY